MFASHIGHRGHAEFVNGSATSLVEVPVASTESRAFDFDSNLQSMRSSDRPVSAPPVSRDLHEYGERGAPLPPLPAQTSWTKGKSVSLAEIQKRWRASRDKAAAPVEGPSAYAAQYSREMMGTGPAISHELPAPEPPEGNATAAATAALLPGGEAMREDDPRRCQCKRHGHHA